MITPIFTISQTARTLILSIRAPHSRPKEIQLSADAYDFHFYTSPYLLHLRFEHPITLRGSVDVSEPAAHTSYSLETGVATITLHKTPPYPHFSRLDMLSTLLVTKPTNRAPPSIEVVSTTTTTTTPSSAPVDPAEKLIDSPSGLRLPLRELTLSRPTYGFAARYQGVFAVRADDATQIVELPDPDCTPVWRRRALRKAAEDKKFCADHYIADFLLREEWAHVLRFEYDPPDTERPLDEARVDAVLKLPRREYLEEVDAGAAADLAGLLFAAAYDWRVTLGERCVESAWTVARVCATTAFLEGFKGVREAVVAASRRSLAYPLYRSWELAGCVLRDLKALFDGCTVDVLRGRLFRVLLELREIFEDDKLLRLHCDLFLIDYCVWIQTVGDKVLERLREEVLGIEVERYEMECDLKALEARAKRMREGEKVEKEEQTDTPEAVGVSGQEMARGKAAVEEKVANGNGVTISALSAFPSKGFEIIPVMTRKLHLEERSSSGSMYSSYYEYESSSEESFTS